MAISIIIVPNVLVVLLTILSRYTTIYTIFIHFLIYACKGIWCIVLRNKLFPSSVAGMLALYPTVAAVCLVYRLSRRPTQPEPTQGCQYYSDA